MTNPPDYRALCAELIGIVEEHCNPDEYALPDVVNVLSRARTLLAQPEPEGMTDEGIMRLACTLLGYEYTPSLLSDPENGVGSLDAFPSELLTFARAVLQRYPRPTIQPVPIAERLPGPEDCDAEGRCWLCGKVEGDWRLLNPARSGVPQLKYCFSHWLPHYALPIPTPTP